MKKLPKREIMIPTKFGTFLCIFESNAPDPRFSVIVPGAPGFVTGGRTLAEAKKLAKTGLEFHCECLLFEERERLRHAKERVLASTA